MRNPWLKKNPFLSAWLSAANGVVGHAQGTAAANAKRQAAMAVTKATQEAIAMWMTPFNGAPKGRIKRRSKK
jgi:hypothetical protein